MSVLVTGAAGYIGSHAVKVLVEQGDDVIAVDNLSRGHRQAVHPAATFYQRDIADTDAVTHILRDHAVETVVHFAALAYVGESVQKPLRYYANNTAGTISLLRAMQRASVRRLVFSSTCATYGIPDQLPIVETTAQQPINPYGSSKLFIEQILRDTVAADPEFGFIALRYFNVAGCARDSSLGEDHDPETHLIPLALQTALGQRETLTVFGTDYPTPDGTCIRDYLHVDDLCRAHLLAIESIAAGDARFYNLGIGRGISVREVIESARRVTGCRIAVEESDRRPGDPPSLFASAEAIGREIGWRPELVELDDIIASAWSWFQKHPHGYGDARGPTG